jgi:hypothetical protein
MSFELEPNVPVNMALVYVKATSGDGLAPHPAESVVTGDDQPEATAKAQAVAAAYVQAPSNGFLAQVFVPGEQFKNEN